MEYQNIILEKDKMDGRIAKLTLNRPEKMNPLSEDMLNEIFDAIEEIDQDEEVVVLIIKGAGRSFSSGYELGSTAGSSGGESTIPRLGQSRRGLIRSVERYLRLWNFRKPTIAQVHGYCLSGATELIAMCDIVIAAEDAQFGHIAGRDLGTLRTNGLYPLLMGIRKTKQFLFTGDFIDGKTAEQWGLINYAVPADELEEEAYDMARRIVRIPLELLSYHKATTNEFFEIMGLHAYLMSSSHYAASAVAEVGGASLQKGRETGMKEYFKLRDLPWREHKRVTLPKQRSEK